MTYWTPFPLSKWSSLMMMMGLQQNISYLLPCVFNYPYTVPLRKHNLKCNLSWASLVAQWLRVCLPMQGTWVRALVWEDPTCRRATGPVSHNCWASASGACAPQQERPRQWEVRTPRWRVAPARRNWRKPSHRNEDPTQPKINKWSFHLKKKKKVICPDRIHP